MLDIDGLTVRYGAYTAIDDLSWRAGGAGSMVTALLGPSGCGKSTLIRAVAGLEPVAGGRIRFDGRDLAGTQVHRRDFGVVFQDGQLFAGRTVAANIAYGLRVRRWSRAEIAARVTELLDIVGLPGLAGRRVTELSGGQAQRVALARALAPRPRLLLLDEPLAALDRRLRDQLATEIADIVRATATPTIMVTHDHVEAALMADSISVMRDGTMVGSATPGDLWRYPADEWTARFLGCTTVLDAEVTDGLAHTVLGAVTVAGPDGRRQLGLRPESVEVVAAQAGEKIIVPASPEVTVTGVIDLPTGPRARLATPVGEIDAVTVAPIAAGAPARIRLVPERIALIGCPAEPR